MPKSKKDKLDELRKKIDEVDDKILNLLNERASIVKKVGEIKKKIKANFYVPYRETEIIKRLQSKTKGPFPKSAIKPVFREIISACLSLEKPLKVGYLGPPATFTHEAAMRYFGHGAQYIPFRSISEIFDEVYKSRVDMGVVPVENSTEGVVSHTLDMFINYDLRISGEIIIPISHCLLSKAFRKDDIRTIYSHSQAFAQCRNWLEKNMAHCAFIETKSTAEAAEMALKDEKAGAIAGENAGKIYDLNVLERNIQDTNDNSTRFLIIGKVEHKATGNDKTSILFSIKDEPGTLYNMLAPFAKRGINLTKIESRPIKTKAWEYVFFLDLDGHISDKKVSEAIEELRKYCIFLKIAGSYPKFTKEVLK
jgi:chorismate mutase/prephenate dehydratase